MRVRHVSVQLFGASGVWSCLVDDQAERDLCALLNMVANQTVPGEEWRDGKPVVTPDRVPQLVRIKAVDGCEMWLRPGQIMGLVMGAYTEWPPAPKPAGSTSSADSASSEGTSNACSEQ